MRILLIGYGAIGRMLAEAKLDGRLQPEIVGILVRSAAVSATRDEVALEVAVVSTTNDAIPLEPDLVVECAGQSAVEQYGEAFLRTGIDLMVIATGALADVRTRNRLYGAADCSGAQIHLPAGATAGIDGLGALKVGGLERVTYTSTKPPLAWKGTLADGPFHLDKLKEPTVIFSGRADEAAQLYPQNANIAATVAIAGAGFDATFVKLVADPNAVNNVGRIDAKGRFGHMKVEMTGEPMPSNPKTSAVTALSLIRAINNISARVAI